MKTQFPLALHKFSGISSHVSPARIRVLNGVCDPCAQVEGLSAVCLCNNACVLEGPQLTVNLEKAYRKEIFTKKDAADIRAWAAATDNYIDFVSMSFCHDAADVEACRAVLSR